MKLVGLLLLVTAVCFLPAGVASVSAESRAALLSKAGWEALRAGRLEDASRAFHDAIAMNGKDATLYLGLGLVAHLQGNSTEARAQLQEALRINPGLTPASLLLGSLAYQAGELEVAIRVYEDALVYAPEHPQLRTQLDRWRKESTVHGGFQRALTPHFTVLFEGPEEQQLAARALEGLEAAYWRIGTTLLTYPPTVLTVVLYTEQQFRDITRTPEWAGGMYDGRIRVPMRGALDHPGELEKVLAHEFTHALVRSLAPRGVPTWVDEGLAVVFEADETRWAEQVIRRAPKLIPLPQLHDGFLKLSREQALLAYAESAMAMQALLSRHGALSVSQFLQDLAQGQAFPVAFEHRFFVPYDQFVGTWAQPLRETSESFTDPPISLGQHAVAPN